MNNQPIGVLDSGIGGLTVWQEIIKELPQESTIYIGDSKNTPYGPRSREEILTLASGMIEFLLEQQVKLIVVACNTITVSGIDVLRKKFSQVPLIGTVPVIKTAVKASKKGIIGVLSTTRTAESEYQKSLIEQFAAGKNVINRGTNLLVPRIENGELDTPDVQKILEEELHSFKQAGVDVVALGCTHFPFLKKRMQAILGDQVTLLDSGAAIARQVRKVLENNNTLGNHKKSKHTVFTTGDVVTIKRIVTKAGLHAEACAGVTL